MIKIHNGITMNINMVRFATSAVLMGARCLPFSLQIRRLHMQNIVGRLVELNAAENCRSGVQHRAIEYRSFNCMSHADHRPFSTSPGLLRLLRTRHSRLAKNFQESPTDETMPTITKGNLGQDRHKFDQIYHTGEYAASDEFFEKGNNDDCGFRGTFIVHDSSSTATKHPTFNEFSDKKSLPVDIAHVHEYGKFYVEKSSQRDRIQTQRFPPQNKKEHFSPHQQFGEQRKIPPEWSDRKSLDHEQAHVCGKFNVERNCQWGRKPKQYEYQRGDFPPRQHTVETRKRAKEWSDTNIRQNRDEGRFGGRAESKMVYSSDVDTVSADLMDMEEKRRKTSDGMREGQSYFKQNQKKRKTETLRVADGNDLLFGISPCLLALRHQKREVHQVYVIPAFQKSKRSEVAEIQTLLEERSLRVAQTNRRVLDMLSGHSPHQGICMETSRLHFESLPEEPEEASTTVSVRLILDQIRDPMNLGALLRSAYFLGVEKVITSKTNCCSLTPTVSKASSGVMEVVPVYAAEDIPSLLEREKEMGWSIVGAAIRDPNADMTSDADQLVTPCQDYVLSKPVILVIGSEGFGLSAAIKEICSEFITVCPGRQLHGGIDSLNVSVATGILLHSLLGKRRSRGSE